MKKQFKAFAYTFTLVSALSLLAASSAKASCASTYEKRSKIYINVSITTANGSSVYIDNGINREPDFIRGQYVRASDLLSQAKSKKGGDEFSKMVGLMMKKHPHALPSEVEKTVREILLEAESSDLFCKDTDGDGARDLTPFRSIRKHVRQETLTRLHPEVANHKELSDLEDDAEDCPSVENYLVKEEFKSDMHKLGSHISNGTKKVVQSIKHVTKKSVDFVKEKTSKKTLFNQ